jgi:hypothetical protein
MCIHRHICLHLHTYARMHVCKRTYALGSLRPNGAHLHSTTALRTHPVRREAHKLPNVIQLAVVCACMHAYMVVNRFSTSADMSCLAKRAGWTHRFFCETRGFDAQAAKRAGWTHRLRTRSAKKVAAPLRVQITMSCVEGSFSKVKCLLHLLNKDAVESTFTFENVCRLRRRPVRVGDLLAELRHALLQHLLREHHLVELLRRHECRELDICLGWHPPAGCLSTAARPMVFWGVAQG